MLWMSEYFKYRDWNQMLPTTFVCSVAEVLVILCA